MKIVGIDLSGPRNFADTCLVSFEVRGEEIHLVEVREGADDNQILEAISSLRQNEPIAIGIDAPLSYNPTGGDRPSDSELRRFVRARGGRAGIMPPPHDPHGLSHPARTACDAFVGITQTAI